jgi:hypothetical protein
MSLPRSASSAAFSPSLSSRCSIRFARATSRSQQRPHPSPALSSLDSAINSVAATSVMPTHLSTNVDQQSVRPLPLLPCANRCARASACLAGYCARSSCYENLTAHSTCAHALPRAPHVTLRGLCVRHLCMCIIRLCASMVLRYRCPTGCVPPPTSSTPHVEQPTAAGGRSPTLCRPLRSHIGLLASQALRALLAARI